MERNWGVPSRPSVASCQMVNGERVGLDAVLFVMAVMAGRVVPMFTNNGVPGAGARRIPWLERAALGGVLAGSVTRLPEHFGESERDVARHRHMRKQVETLKHNADAPSHGVGVATDR